MKLGKRSKRVANKDANIQAIVQLMRIEAEQAEQQIFANKTANNGGAQ